jgi:hypothetical protein
VPGVGCHADALAQAGEAEVVEARDLRLGEALVPDVGECRAAPEPERLPQGRRRVPRRAASELVPAPAGSAPRSDRPSWSLIMAAVQAALTSVIFLLSIRRGEGGLSTTELTMIALAGAGVIGWIVADQPIIATTCVVVADLVGAAMMIPKTYRDPNSETLATFAFAGLGGALAAGAVGAIDLSLLLYLSTTAW